FKKLYTRITMDDDEAIVDSDDNLLFGYNFRKLKEEYYNILQNEGKEKAEKFKKDMGLDKFYNNDTDDSLMEGDIDYTQQSMEFNHKYENLQQQLQKVIQPNLEHNPELTDTNLLRSEEHTSELQSRENLVCRLLLEKKKK